MSDPISDVTGLTTTANVSKAEFVAYEKARAILIMDDVDEVRATDLSGRWAILVNGSLYIKSTTSTAADNGTTVLKDLSEVGRWLRALASEVDFHPGSDLLLRDGVSLLLLRDGVSTLQLGP